MLALLLAAGVHRLKDPQPAKQLPLATLALWFAFAVIVNLAVSRAGFWAWHQWPPPYLFSWPKIAMPWLLVFDLTAGLALTAVVEELMARRLAWHVLAPRFPHPWATLTVSSLLFGLGHWGAGPWNTISATLGGAALFLAYQRTGSLMLVIAAHYTINLIIHARWQGVW